MAPFRMAGRAARKSLELPGSCEPMQEPAAPLVVHRLRKELAALLSQVLDPRRIFRRELPLELALQALRERRTVSVGRDGDFEIASPYHGRVVEIAVRWIVDHVREDAATPRLFKHARVKVTVGRRD